jgi:hypothetical protein
MKAAEAFEGGFALPADVGDVVGGCNSYSTRASNATLATLSEA